MKSLKVKLCLIVALAVTMIVTLGIFIGNVVLADRYFTLSGATIFTTSGKAEVWAHREFIGEGEEDPDKEFDAADTDYAYYTMFTFEKSDDAVSYKRNLAYNWFYNANDMEDAIQEPYKGEDDTWWIYGESTGIAYDEDVECKVGDNGNWFIGEQDTGVSATVLPYMQNGYLHLEIGFEDVNFTKFVIAFETQQYRMTKDEKTTNYIIFVPVENEQKVYAIIIDDENKDDAELDAAELIEEYADKLVELDIDHISIQLSEGEAGGKYVVTITAGAAEYTDIFTNVGKMYAKYVSSSTKPVIPITFKAEFEEEDEEGNPIEHERARMAIYELNGQSFRLTSTSTRSISQSNGHFTGGQVNDTQPPVLCLDTGISFVEENSELTFSYTAIDVFTQSPTIETGFFMLTIAQQEDDEFNPDNFSAEGLFKTVTSSDDLYIYPHTNHYIPQSGTDYNNDEGYGTKFVADEDAEFLPTAAIKIYLKLTDTTDGESTYVFLDWFVEKEYLLNINGYNYIAVATDEQGVTYNYGEGNHSFSEDNEIWKAYNEEVQKAAKDLYAGSDEDFYLPSVEMLFSADNATKYEDMTFSIYYMVEGVASSNASRSASQLYIDLNTDGEYLFTVYATDASGNGMWYWDEEEQEVVKFAANEIWTMYDDEDDEGLTNRLPWFRFEAKASEISIEDPGEQSTAYVGVSYTASGFEIKGVSTKAVYTLYRFEHELYAEANGGKVLTYQEFMEMKKDLFENHGEYFTQIEEQSKLNENTEEYDEFYAYAWNASSRTFIPQEENAFYLIQCEVSSTKSPTREHVREYMGIAASATPTSIAGENTWVSDNMTSIILLSIAGVAFIGIIVLIFIKPKESGDIDLEFEQNN